ncbi:MAG TPA: OsmC family protein [Pyrinomonadaceae bacterium]|jgi:uncharacterized OsmC-like protein
MKISASVQSSFGSHEISVQTNDNRQTIGIAPKQSGFGSAVNGGELLFLALATCYCNDVYREAAKRGIEIERVEVTVEGDFGAEGAPAENIKYRAKIAAKASEEEIRALIEETDRVAEIQNTLRKGVPVALTRIEAVAV